MENENVSIRLDPRVTLAVVVTLFVQAGGVLIWAGAQSERLNVLERRAEIQVASSERLVRLEAQMDQARASLARIEGQLDRDGR